MHTTGHRGRSPSEGACTDDRALLKSLNSPSAPIHDIATEGTINSSDQETQE